jgi:FMN phosphatase YigB (HAD superfamily)
MFNGQHPRLSSPALNLEPVQAVLFDLDGTLVDVDMRVFIPLYLHRLAGRMEPYAEPPRVERTLLTAMMAMLAGTDGQRSLEELLRSMLADDLQLAWPDYQAGLARFCRDDLPQLQPLVKPHPLARNLVEACLDRGWRVALATNPVFPREVIDARLAWGGLADIPFQPVTSYETSRQCKPHPGFFHDLLAKLDLPPQACLMVGNDTLHDLAAGRVGMPTCLLTTWRIDRAPDLPADWEGSHQTLLEQLRTLPA